MTLEDLGYNSELEEFRKVNQLDTFDVARIISAHKDRYTVKNADGEYDAELIGNLRFTASNKSELPAVGDWVSISAYDDKKVLIHRIFPRKSTIERKAVGKLGQIQIIAANIDFGLIVQSVNRDFNINRLERYLTICYSSNIKPIIVLSKIDLIENEKIDKFLNQVKERIENVPIFAISNQSQMGVERLKSALIEGCTYCLLGSSGVGKSSLINTLSGVELMETGDISGSIQRGKHVTSHRELFLINGRILIDNPGMREVGITSGSTGLEMTFDEVLNLSKNCKFNDCTHTNEIGCAILEAIENEELDVDTYSNYIKMEKERIHFESDARERKKKDKDLGKLIKTVKKQRRNNKY